MTAPEQASAWCHWLASRGVTLSQDEMREMFERGLAPSRVRFVVTENPYPAEVFTMTMEEYVKAVPDPKLRTAISGCLGRHVWDVCCQQWQEQLRAQLASSSEDSRRLDWMESHKQELRYMPISKYWYLLRPGQQAFTVEESRADTIREALDFAMAQQKGGG